MMRMVWNNKEKWKSMRPILKQYKTMDKGKVTSKLSSKQFMIKKEIQEFFIAKFKKMKAKVPQ